MYVCMCVCACVCNIFPLQKTCRMNKPKIIKEIDYLWGVGTGEDRGGSGTSKYAFFESF